MNDKEFIAVFHYDNGGTNRCGAEPYRYAEEIVRCKACKWAEPTNDGWNSATCNFYGETTLTMPTDGFCSYGERREP